jgi:hypothetical protein
MNEVSPLLIFPCVRFHGESKKGALVLYDTIEDISTSFFSKNQYNKISKKDQLEF